MGASTISLDGGATRKAYLEKKARERGDVVDAETRIALKEVTGAEMVREISKKFHYAVSPAKGDHFTLINIELAARKIGDCKITVPASENRLGNGLQTKIAKDVLRQLQIIDPKMTWNSMAERFNG